MNTTIQVSDTTIQLLREMKTESGKTFDQIIRELVVEKEQIPVSMYGTFLPKD